MNNKLTQDYHIQTFHIPREHSEKHDSTSFGKSVAKLNPTNHLKAHKYTSSGCDFQAVYTEVSAATFFLKYSFWQR